MFTPTLLAGRSIALDPQTQARLSRAETMLVRLEDKAEDCEVRAALHRVLARLEAVSSIRVEGKRPCLSTIIRVESLLAFDGTDTAERLAGLDALDFSNGEEWQTTLEVLYYQMALGFIYRENREGAAERPCGKGEKLAGFAASANPAPPVRTSPSTPASAPFTPQDLLDLHALSRFGLPAARVGTHVRTRPYRSRTAPDGSQTHVAPEPADVPALLDDLCAFINREVYSPIGQAAVAHFQFEGIKPFKSGIDKTGRLMSHAIIHRRDLAHRLIAPIGLEPAIDTRSHAAALLPYRFGALLDREAMEATVSRWADFCAHATEVSCRAADVYLDAILRLRDAWFERFGRPNRGSALEALLGLMPGHPVLTVRQAASLVGKSVSSVNDALLKLEAAGIVRSDEGLQRNRVYVAAEALDMLESLERRMMPNRPVARDSVLPHRACAIYTPVDSRLG